MNLSPRQREVWELIAKGMTNLEIAKALGAAQSTVRQHHALLSVKLGSSNRVHLALMFHNLMKPLPVSADAVELRRMRWARKRRNKSQPAGRDLAAALGYPSR